ncbi:MAG TPA: magnesium and cobalt transport protein CorA [Rubrobacteraceae bacterium]|nr:magnesium and cobalt transport protein CorA [Rubrobacteraceae bacterium]
MIVDSAVYVDGRRSAACPLGEIRQTCRESGGFAWVGLHDPSSEEFDSVARELGLSEDMIRDTIREHLRPKVERYGDLTFVVLRAARYLEIPETVEFGEVLAFVGPDFVVTIRRGEAPALSGLRHQLEGEPQTLRRGPMAVLYAVMDRVVSDYGPVVEGLENDIDEIETEVFGGNSRVSRRIYELSREVIQFHRATQPLAAALKHLSDTEDQYPEFKRRLRVTQDRLLRATEQVEGFRELLTNILSVNLTMVSVRQNEQVQKVSSWAAILVVPTIITGIYGMNFRYMPELSWSFGYPFSLLLMLAVSGLLYLGFKRSGWL